MKKTDFRILILLSVFSLWLSWPGIASIGRTLKDHEIQKLKENIAKDPKNLKSREFLAEHYAKTKDWPKVIEYLKPVSELLPEKPLNHLAQAYLSTNDIVGAESVTKIMLSRKELSEKGVRMIVLIWSAQVRQMPTAEEQARQMKIDQAVEILKKAEEAHPKNMDLYKLHISFLREFVDHFAFDCLKVIEDLESNLKKLNPEAELEPEFYSMRCEFSYISQFQTKKALEVCEEALEKDPDNHRNYIYLGKIFMNTGEVKKGQRMLASVGKKFSDSEDALKSTANYYYEAKNLPKAYDYYKKAAGHKKASPDAFLGLAMVAFELKKYKEALDAFGRHCAMTKTLHQEFRKASGLLKDDLEWQRNYRNTMRSCNATP